MRRWLLLAVLPFAVAVPLFAHDIPFSISPESGPVGGGNEVIVKGNFGTWPYSLIFGDVAVPAERRDEHTLAAIAPPHLPGSVPITVFEYDFGIQTGLTYTYTGALEDSFERMLLPVFTPPIHGNFGSEFRTKLNVRLAKGERAELHGVHFACIVLCVQRPDSPIVLTANYPELEEEQIERTGTPGAFLYVPKSQANNLSMNLRAFDVSRASDSFGTQLPIVRRGEFTQGYQDKIVIVGIPTDPKFRNHLRIYSAGTTAAHVIVEMANNYTSFPMYELVIPPGESPLRPGYVDFTNFPVNDGTVRLEIRYSHNQNTNVPPPELWAFVSVTNNETQQITTITPR